MQKQALLVGIDHYSSNIGPLKGCINDVNCLAELLSWNYVDKNNSNAKEKNFYCRKLISNPDDTATITKGSLNKELTKLFGNHEIDMALFYFSGHGFTDPTGGYLVTQDATSYDEGIAMDSILKLINRSPIKHIVVILDCCYSGNFGGLKVGEENLAFLRKGVSVVTASNEYQTALELNGNGLFTEVLCNGLSGEAADLLGNVTVSSMYNHASMFFGPWDQRPQFKASLSQDVTLRKAHPRIELSLLRKITYYFPHWNYKIPLDPSYEPTAEPKNPDNEMIFSHLQEFVKLGLVEPINAKHMFFAAMNKKHCGLTPLGKLYWKMLDKEKI